MVTQPLRVMKLRTKGLASYVGATFGSKLRIDRKTHDPKDHQGWDLDAEPGTFCYAVADGVVLETGFHKQFGYFINIQINPGGPTNRTGPGTRAAFYAHLSGFSVSEGNKVREGQPVGLTGTSGNAKNEPPHLHFEIRTISTSSPGKGLVGRVDPATVLGYEAFQSKATDGLK